MLAQAESLEASRGVGPEVVSLYEEVLSSLEPLEPGRLATVQRKVADWCADHGESERALSLYLECDPPDSVTPDRAAALARIAMEAGDDAARRQYQARAQAAPARDLIELFRSAQAYEREHRYQEAAALYRQVIDTADAPNLVKADAHFNLAFCLRVLRRYDEAIAEAEKAEKLGKKVDPGFKILLNLRR